MAEPGKILGNVEEEFPCKNDVGLGHSSGSGAAAQQQCRPVPASSEAYSQRSRVYDSLLRKWRQAAPSAEPRPRSSHPRVLGRQALITRQRGESFSGKDASTLLPSWGSLSDTMSPAAQIAWREQLLRRKVSRLAGVPMTVLLRQRVHGGATAAAAVAATGASATAADATADAAASSSATAASATATATATATVAAAVATSGYQVVAAAASPTFCPKLTAGAVIEGKCPVVTVASSSSSSSSSPAAASGPVKVLLGSGGPRVYEAFREMEHAVGSARGRDRGDGDEKLEKEDGVEAGAGAGVGVEAAAERLGRKSSLLTAKIPVRGFHLVDLHGVVRNYVEWKHCLPKVEACFRVGDNRDEVLLGVAHTLGVRLTCSSVHDVKAAVAAARRVSASAAPSSRLLDTHVCRPPSLLRVSSAAGVQVYEVDSADELRRVWVSRCRVYSSRTATSRESKQAMPPRSDPDGGGPADVLIRLAMPFRPARQSPKCSATSTDGTSTATALPFSRPLEAAYGARTEDVVEIVRAAAATSARLDATLSIVGFSIDVGPACRDDSLSAAVGVELEAAAAAARPPPGTSLAAARTPPDTRLAAAHSPAGTGTGSRSHLPYNAAVPGEAVPSATLSEDIDAAIAAAVEMARCAAAAATAVTTAAAADTAVASSLARAAIVEGANSEAKGEDRVGRSRTTPSPRAPFVFQRLHVTGLGEGGARGEPLTALKEALYRHLPKAGSDDGRFAGTASAGGAGSKPFAVSADATAHLVAGGVWSTVASIIGRKDVARVTGPSFARAAEAGGGNSSGSGQFSGSGSGSGSSSENSGGDGGAVCANAAGGGVGAMYYIDDGCYGSLSGALLRGVQMQPSPLSPAFAGEPITGQDEQGAASATASVNAGSGSSDVAARSAVSRVSLPCTVWGPTCDGLDCVSRVTPLPDDMEPGRDWLFFPDRGTRAGADATDFNGLKPLDLFYCLRQ